MDFHGKNAIVTGAAAGIGQKTVSLLAQHGAAGIMLVDIDRAGLEEEQRILAQQYPACKLLIHPCDVSSEEAVTAAAETAIRQFGHVDILINNAGVFRCDMMPFHQQTSEMWKKKTDINIFGTLYFCRALIGHMYENGSGRIVNVSSVAALYGIANMVDYSMTKGAVLSFTYALAREAAPHGVCVNCVSPGNIQSKNGDGGETFAYLGRRGEPDECANVICFLASEDASYVSGSNYVVDGCRKKI